MVSCYGSLGRERWRERTLPEGLRGETVGSPSDEGTGSGFHHMGGWGFFLCRGGEEEGNSGPESASNRDLEGSRGDRVLQAYLSVTPWVGSAVAARTLENQT